MAMNDISFLATTEQDTLLASRNSSLDRGSEGSGAEFLSQLHNAHNSIEPEKKGNTKADADAENYIAVPKHKQPHESKAQNDEQNVESAEQDTVSGDTMLAQINSAHAISTSVTNSYKIEADSTKSTNNSNTSLLNDSFVQKAAVQDTDEEKNSDAIASSPSIKLSQSTKVASEEEKSTTLTNLLAKDMGATTAGKVLDSLTPEQRLQLNTQAQAITNADTSNINNVSSLKEMLAQFITDNEHTQNATLKQSVSSEINTLNTSEKQTLLAQLNAYIKKEQPQGEQLKALEQAANELEASIEIKLVDNTKIKQNTSVASDTPNTIAQASAKSVNKADTETNKAAASSSDDLAKQLEQLSKEGLKSMTAEQSPARVAQIFTQLTAAINAVQANSTGLYEGLNNEQGLVDSQFLQSQQLQSAAQVKQVSIDPGVMQAINIVKSDAAKLLQERVSSMLSINNKQAEIRLDPPEMGSMQIRIRSDAEQAQINFVVQNQQAKEALEQSMPRLREMLAQQGLELGESTISYGQSGGENAEQSEGGGQGGLANSESINSENDKQADTASQSSLQQSSSSIDYYA